jgi:hypothetical protein
MMRCGLERAAALEDEYLPAVDASQELLSEGATFSAVMSLLFDTVYALFHISSFTGKEGDKSLATAQQCLLDAQHAVDKLHAATLKQRASLLAWVLYCTALYALSTNDTRAADRLLEQALAGLTASAASASLFLHNQILLALVRRQHSLAAVV